jgi:hypothetical protein
VVVEAGELRDEVPEHQCPLAGLRMHPDDRVLRLEGRALEVGARERLVGVLVDDTVLGVLSVVVLVGVHGPQRVDERAQRVRQRGVRRRGVGPDRVPAVVRDGVAAQDGERRRGVDERDVGVPAVGRHAAVGGQGEHVLAAGVDGGVGGGERTEQLRERPVLHVVEMVLAAQEDDLVLEDRRAQGRELGPVEVSGEAQIVDAGADPAAEAVDGRRGRGVPAVEVVGGHGVSSFRRLVKT